MLIPFPTFSLLRYEQPFYFFGMVTVLAFSADRQNKSSYYARSANITAITMW
jgi:hypothetical protein